MAAYRYDPFGRLLAQSGTVTQPFQFATKRTDAGTGLVYYGYRFYVPEVGRWLTRDPLGEAGCLNLYAFNGNNPVNWVDPFGLKARCYRNLSPEEILLLIDEAKSWVGTPYDKTTKAGPNAEKGHNGGADCSGAVANIYKNAGFPYPCDNSNNIGYSSYAFPKNGVPGYFEKAPFNVPHKGDVGWWKGHMLIYDDDADGRNDAWSARRPGRSFSPSMVDWWGWEKVIWYRYLIEYNCGE